MMVLGPPKDLHADGRPGMAARTGYGTGPESR